MLVEGFAQVASAFPRAGILAAAIAQDRDYEAAVRARVAALGLSDRIVITTDLVGRDARQALDAADIFALPSHQEGFSMSLVEAMGRGLPLLITDRCHMNMIGPEGAGQVVPPTPDGLAHGLRALLTLTDAEMAATGTRSRELARQYAWPNVASQMLEHYRAAVRA